jgi:hypothetical protein
MKFAGSTILTVTLIAAAMAQQPAKPAAAPAAKPAPAAAQKQVSVVQKHMSGLLVSLDAQKQTFVVKLKSVDYPFQVNASTKISNGSADIAFSTLKSGHAVSVDYLRDMTGRIATSIIQNAPATAPVKAAAPANVAQSAPAKVAAPAPAPAKTATPAPVKAAEPAPAKVATPAPANTAAPAPAQAQATPAPAPVKAAAAPAPAPVKAAEPAKK